MDQPTVTPWTLPRPVQPKPLPADVHRFDLLDLACWQANLDLAAHAMETLHLLRMMED